MKYGDGFWVVKDGVRVPREHAYPETVGFEYNDGTGRVGEFLLKDFTVDYTPPGERQPIRMTVCGDLDPVLHVNSFDFDFASIPWLFRLSICDKADHRIRVGSLFHDMLYCNHAFSRAFTDRMLVEMTEAYGMDRYRNWKIHTGVRLGGWYFWNRHGPGDAAVYKDLFKMERVKL